MGLEPTIQLAGKKTLLCQSNSLGPTISNSGKIDVRTFTSVKDFPEAWSTGSPWRRRSMCPREPSWDRSLRGWRVGRIQDRTQWPDAKTSQPLESSQVCNFPHKSNHQGCLKMPPEVCEEEAVPRPPVNLNSTCYQWSSEKGSNVYFCNDSWILFCAFRVIIQPLRFLKYWYSSQLLENEIALFRDIRLGVWNSRILSAAWLG